MHENKLQILQNRFRIEGSKENISVPQGKNKINGQNNFIYPFLNFKHNVVNLRKLEIRDYWLTHRIQWVWEVSWDSVEEKKNPTHTVSIFPKHLEPKYMLFYFWVRTSYSHQENTQNHFTESVCSKRDLWEHTYARYFWLLRLTNERD